MEALELSIPDGDAEQSDDEELALVRAGRERGGSRSGRAGAAATMAPERTCCGRACCAALGSAVLCVLLALQGAMIWSQHATAAMLAADRAAGLGCPFRSMESFTAKGTFDPRRRWVALSAEQVSAAEAGSPFTGCPAGAPRYNKTLAIVFAFYVDRARNTGSGLGSLTLQILDVARYAVANGLGVRFPDPAQWTYGAPGDAPGPTAWNSVFHEITDPACIASGAEVQHVCGVSCGTPWAPPRGAVYY
jgi:hypothetical protein